MESARVEKYSTEVESFLDSLFEGQEGYVYTPTKNPKSGYWQPYFFQWPEQRDAIVTHLLDQTTSKDCYVAPSLFKAPSDKKQAWKGTNYVWAEFDGNAPKTTPDELPAPTIRIQSSESGHEHWYWRLREFETDHRIVEGLAKRLTYTLDADKSGWDCSQVLRPPGTVHRTSRKRVRLLSHTSKQHDYGDFTNLVEVDTEPVVVNTNFEDVPGVQEVVAKYKWDKEAWDLFQKSTQKVGSRSSAMTRLGFHCVEMGMSNEEIYSILYNADERWGKFKTRPPKDRAKRLTGIIVHCRSKKTLQKQLHLSEEDVERFVSVADFMQREIKVEWLFEGFMQKCPFAVIGSLPGIGKSTMALRIGANLVLQKDFLIWKNNLEKGMRVGFLSLEMDDMECAGYIGELMQSMTDEEKEVFTHNFFLVGRGYDMPLFEDKWQQNILDEIDRLELDFIIIDSLKAAGGLTERKGELFFNWIRKSIRADRGVGVLLIHHLRKATNGDGASRKPEISDLYGDTFISQHATTAWGLHPRPASGSIEMCYFKVRLAKRWDDFRIKRSLGMTYEMNSYEEPEPPPDDGSEPSESSTNKF